MKAKIPQTQEAAAAFVKKVCTPNQAPQKSQPNPGTLTGITINRPSRCTIVIGGHPAPQSRRNKA